MKLNKAVLFIVAFCATVSVARATPVNVTSYGAVGNGSTDNRPMIQNAVNYAASIGETVYFPPGYYNVIGTISVPSNVRLQGMGPYYHCQIRQMAAGVPLFEIEDNRFNIIFKDLYLLSNIHGWRLTTPQQVQLIREDGTTGISLKAAGTGISNIVIENVRISQFTHGISATSLIPGYDASISNVKISNYASDGNEYSLYTKTRGADGWDVQNMDVYPMYDKQNGIFLELSGRMSFLQLSCAGNISETQGSYPGICAKLWGNGNTYFRNMHVEGPRLGFCVGSDCEPFSSGNKGENASLLTIENSATAGEFHRATNLVSINNRFWLDWAGSPRYKFIGRTAANNSWVMSCGDVWVSGIQNTYYTTVTAPSDAYPGLTAGVHGCVNYYHSSVPTFAQGYTPDNIRLTGEGLTGEVNVTAYGADPKDNGGNDRNAFVQALAATTEVNVPIKRIFVPAGTYDISSTLQLSDGVTIVGEPGTIIRYTGTDGSLFKVVNAGEPVRGIAWRNLVLTASPNSTDTPHGVGIEMVNFSPTEKGAAADFQIQGVDFNNFKTGILVQPTTGDLSTAYNPMFDSVSLKEAHFSGNETAILIRSQNASNWNLENISVNIPDGKEGVRIDGIGLMSIRGLSCTSSGTGSACVTIQRQNGLSIQGLSATNVTNALVASWENGYTQFPITLRNNDLTAGVYFQGRVYLNSVNNIYPAKLSENSSSKVVKFAAYREDHPGNYFYGGQSDIFSCNDTFKDTSTGHTQYTWTAPIQAYTGSLEKSVRYCY